MLDFFDPTIVVLAVHTLLGKSVVADAEGTTCEHMTEHGTSREPAGSARARHMKACISG